MKTKILTIGIILWTSLFLTTVTFAQYNECAGKNEITETKEVEIYDDVSRSRKVKVIEQKVSTDSYGNAKGNQYDLAIDGAFKGQTVAVLHLYTNGGFDFKKPEAALEEKGFSVYRWLNQPPSPEDLKIALEKSCQLWIISDMTQKLNEEHLKVIKDFFDSGKGVYIWGDNAPYYADANFVAKGLIGSDMTGNVPGDQTVDLQRNGNKVGLVPNHLISTGLQYIYEGVTIATLSENKNLTPLIYGSAGNLVAGIYEKDNKRLILDGGFTRLYYKWDTAGTGRYVKNAAAWLVNYEFFGDEVVAN